MITISLCMIVKNEQETLERCLNSVKDVVDEMIIVDTGSTDRTKEIAGKLTQQIFDFKWIDDFASARNFSFSKATKEYILWLDADDVLLPEESLQLASLKKSLSPSVDVVSMPYHCDFDDNDNVTLNVRRARLVKRSKNYQWEGIVHEDLAIKAGVFYDSEIVITHRKNHSTSDPDRNLKIYNKAIFQGKELTLRDTLHYAMELHQHHEYEKACQYYLKFLDNQQITIEDRIHVYSKLADCFYFLGDREKERLYIFKSFEIDAPRPEFCCRLGYYFLEKNQFSQASFWYKLATECPLPENQWVIQNLASRTWLPHIQLGLCYFQLGNYEQSYHHNKIALSYLPNNENIIKNIKLLEEILK